jgi:hypothetical protein
VCLSEPRPCFDSQAQAQIEPPVGSWGSSGRVGASRAVFNSQADYSGQCFVEAAKRFGAKDGIDGPRFPRSGFQLKQAQYHGVDPKLLHRLVTAMFGNCSFTDPHEGIAIHM